MNIRMRSAPTTHPDVKHPDRLKSLFKLAVPALVALALAGCGTGTVDESRMYQEQEATESSQVESAQQTETARFFAGTPVAGPTSTPQPVLSSLRLSTSVGSNGEPLDERSNAPAGGTIYASARIHDLSPGSTYYAVLGRKDGTAITQGEITVEQGADNAWLSFPFAINGTLPPGEYAVFIYTEGVLLGSLVFNLT